MTGVPVGALERPFAWVLTDGMAGMEAQGAGLAVRIGLPFAVMRIVARRPWEWLPAALWWAPLRALSPRGDRPRPPWPDLLIATGRRSVAPALAIRRAAAGRCYLVQLQDPGVAVRRFDLVVAPRHDRLRGANVVETAGSLHGLTRDSLDAAARRWRHSVRRLAPPRTAVLLGGANRAYRFGVEDGAALGRRLAALGGSVMATVSRRTARAVVDALMAQLDPARSAVWDGRGDNPYAGWLGLADAVVVTSDSVNMATEACATGRPVLVWHLPGGSRKFRAFHALLERGGHARRFEGAVPDWRPVPLDDAGRVSELVRDRLARRGVLP